MTDYWTIKFKWWWGWIRWQPNRLRWAIVRWLSGWGKDGNVLLYGAVGDGKTNDGYALQDAINARRPVYVPPGEFVVGHTLQLGSAHFPRKSADDVVEEFRAAHPDLTADEEAYIRECVRTGAHIFFRCKWSSDE